MDVVDVATVVSVVSVTFSSEVIVVAEDRAVCSELLGNSAANVTTGATSKLRRTRILVKTSS